MSHYSTLQDFQFDADVKDIRGAALYGVDQKKIAKITDVVFDHDEGTIHYLVADMGHDRQVMLPLNHIYRTAVAEDSFETDLDASELDRLPAFDNKVFDSDQSWKSYEQLHRSAIEERDEAARTEVKENWKEDPVLHVEGSDRIVTPAEPEATPAEESVRTQSNRIGIPASELFPDRITDRFTSTTPGAEKITLVPEESARIQDAAYGTANLGPRWDDFEDALLESLPQIRNRCETCSTQQRRVA
jgi:sporulation protein YlmC with PRC-barrel domain